MRPREGGGLKNTLATSSRFLNLSSDFEFAGWGTFSKLKLTGEDHRAGDERLQHLRGAGLLGQFTGAALSGNAVLGSVFYALPAVVAVCGVYSPISLFAATLTPFLWRPIMEELASALPISGAPYSYILNVSRKSLALLGAALLLLDFAATAVVSAATASSYLAGEVALPFPPFVGAALVLVIFALVSLTGLKESARIAFVVLAFHVATMTALGVASSVHWARTGNAQLRQNWRDGQPPSHAAIVRQLFNGFCLGMLGLTGIECTPSYIGRIKPGRFPPVLRNLHLPTIVLNTLMIALVLATVPLEQVLGGANVLSVLAQISAGPWLRKWIVVDAAVVLCGGVLTGILSATELFSQLAYDRVVPQVFLRVLPVSGAPYVSVLVFTGMSGVLYASTGASLAIVSKMFSLVWLTVMALFPLALLLLRFNRGRMPRARTAPMGCVVLALVLTPVVFAGNVAIDPSTAGYFAAYLIGVLVVFAATQNQVHLLRAVYWAYDQYPARSKMWGAALVGVIARLKRQPVCILVRTDEINHLLHMLLYVRENEETSCVKVVHFCDAESGVPSELEANAKILDEAFPEITIDLIIVQGLFSPSNVAALAHRLQIPPSLMFMSCPGPRFTYPIAEFGARVISL
ncbi:amino acid permease-domain-containing protein [Mycena albidolilacea]|uniref:Amino acid permease-domain-containing protein n=1 Tax=Mycena albidolilacea TaxID=1033008 RepID=A0AAD6ZWC9_9AGAR|nr:amino acid permease-domain-containing protein [Mycena albidolilacea]